MGITLITIGGIFSHSIHSNNKLAFLKHTLTSIPSLLIVIGIFLFFIAILGYCTIFTRIKISLVYVRKLLTKTYAKYSSFKPLILFAFYLFL